MNSASRYSKLEKLQKINVGFGDGGTRINDELRRVRVWKEEKDEREDDGGGDSSGGSGQCQSDVFAFASYVYNSMADSPHICTSGIFPNLLSQTSRPPPSPGSAVAGSSAHPHIFTFSGPSSSHPVRQSHSRSRPQPQIPDLTRSTPMFRILAGKRKMSSLAVGAEAPDLDAVVELSEHSVVLIVEDTGCLQAKVYLQREYRYHLFFLNS
ncbi:hypothetical protein L1049_016663 [Liquidambar formosana]|uniref:Uncharacterized protein n=1 Tax=Liquidambar formosana TaxID=63359 RepID=A0AAP0S6S2_LIQFO